MDYLNLDQQKKADNKIIYGIFLSLAIFSLIALFAIGAIVSTKQNGNPNNENYNPTTLEETIRKQGELKQFANYEELVDWLEKNTGEQASIFSKGMEMRPMLGRGVDFGTSFLAEDSVGAPQIQSNELGGDDYSQTNIQVAGVDEADIIKTDGDYIYLINGQNLTIIDAVPATESRIISETDLNTSPQNLYINGNRLAVFGNEYNLADTKHFDFIIPRTTFSFLKIYDISDKTNPKLARELHFEGNYINSRMIGDYIYFLTNKYPNVWADDIIPRVIDGKELLCADNQISGKHCPDIYYFNIPHPSPQITLIAAINIKKDNQEIKQQAYLLGGTNNIYVSTNAFYITNTKYLDEYQLAMQLTVEIIEPRLNEKLKAKIAKIKQADPDVLSEREKLNKMYSITQYYLSSLSAQEQMDIQEEVENLAKEKISNLENELEKTVIHKIAINKDELKSAAQGEVPGTVLNQFSMDEADGYFRIATTRNRRWSRLLDKASNSYNNIYVLDKNLDIVGKLEHLAENERIYSVRFMQNRAYMVTFKQIDPLFVIDLSQAANPKVLGELKIPGFSNYLHPYDNNLLIGLGQNTTTNEWGAVRSQGVKLSLFDVSDVSNPKEIDNYIFSEPNSHSLAQNDHKAFLFSKEKNLLVIPVSAWNSRDYNKNYNAAMVFGIDEKGFEFRGKIDHSHETCDVEECGTTINTYDRSAQVLRSLYIRDNLYTMSTKYLKINALDDLKEIKAIKITEQVNHPRPVPMPEPIPILEIE